MVKPSSLSLGEEDYCDFSGPLTVRFNSNDTDYPVSIEGVTDGGHDISMSLTPTDIDSIMNVLQSQYY